MKRFLLTLLGATLLCGLSPHPAAAQELKTAEFTVNYTNGVYAGKRVKAATDATAGTTDFTLDENDPVIQLTAAPTGTDRYGFGLIQLTDTKTKSEKLTINFNYAHAATGTNPTWGKTSQLDGTILNIFPAGANIKPSVAFSLSMGEQKYITKVVFTLYDFYSGSTAAAGDLFIAPIESLESFTASPTVLYDSKTSSNNYHNTITYTVDGLYGSVDPLCFQALQTTKSQSPIPIQKITVSYYDNSDGWMPKYDTSLNFGRAYGDPIYYQDGDATEWTEATGTSRIHLNGTTVKVKIGKAVTTFTRPSNAATSQHTVTIDPAKYWVMTTKGVSFYTTLDPEYSANEGINEAYGIKYYLSDYASTGISAAIATNNLTKPTGALTTSGDLITGLTKAEGLTAANSTFTVVTAPTQDPWGAYTANNIKNGTSPAFGFEQLTISFTSKDEPARQNPMMPTATIPSDAVLNPTTGIYNMLNDINVTVGLNPKDTYTEAKVYYIIGDTPLDHKTFDKSKATLNENTDIHIDKDCTLSIRSYVNIDGTEVASAVTNYQFKKVETVTLTKAAQLLDKVNEGKLVRLNFPLQILASGHLDADPTTFNIYARDTLDNAIRLVTRVTEAINSISTDKDKRLLPGLAFKATNATTIAGQIFCPAGGAVGTLQFVNDRPVIVLKDEAEGIDNFEYCYSGVAVTYTAVMKNNAKTFVRGTFISNQRDRISADDYGKNIFIRATYNKAEKTFTPLGGTEPIDYRLTTADGWINNYATATITAPSITSTTDGDYGVVGLVEYDSEKDSYYIMPRAITKLPSRPKVTPVSTNNGTQIVKTTSDGDDAATTVIKMVNYRMQVQLEGSTGTTQMYYYSYVNNTTGVPDDKSVTGSASATTQYINPITLNEEKKSTFTFAIQNCNNSGTPIVVSEPFTLTVVDVISTAPVFNSIAEVKQELSGKSADELKDQYYKVAANMVVLGFDPTEQYMYLRDAESDGYIVAYTKNKWSNAASPFIHGTNKTYTTFSYFKNPRIGDQITEITFTPVEMGGVIVADLSGLEGKQTATGVNAKYDWGYIKGHCYSYTDVNKDPDKSIWGELELLEPMYKNHMERLGAPIRKDLCYDASNEADAAKLTFDDSNIADYVAINNVKLTANEDTDPVFSTTGLGTNLEIDWSLLPAAEPTAALAEDGDETEEPAAKDVKAEIIKAYNDAKTEGKDIYFNIQGHIFKNATATGYALKIKDYSITEAAPLPTVKVTAEGNEIVATPDADDASKLAASFIKTVSVSSPDAELEDADFEILMSINGGEYEAYDAAKLAGFDTHNTTVAFKCPLRPGYLAGDRITTLTLSKDASDVNTLAEVAGGDNANNLYHFRSHLKVVAAAEGTVMAADKEGNLAVVAAAPAEAEEGKYLADIVLVRNSKNTASLHEIDADAELLDEDESYAIATPAPATLFGVTVAEGNATDAEGNIYTIDPTFAAIPEGDAEAWKLTGYVLADDNDKPVIYLTASQAIDRVALPVITPAEAAFLDKTTVSITCDTEGAAIEYSLDGGKTWNPYTGAFDATASGEILARATADDMLPSHEAKASVVREYLSGDVTITVDEQEALTVITITGPAGAAIYYSLDGTAEKLYNGPLTLTNDTQAVINGQIKAYALESGKRPGAESVRDYQIKFKPEVTGIDGVGADQEAGSVRVEGNSIIVPEGAQTFDIAGRRVNPQGLPRGIYIVRLASGKAVKAVVK